MRERLHTDGAAEEPAGADATPSALSSGLGAILDELAGAGPETRRRGAASLNQALAAVQPEPSAEAVARRLLAALEAVASSSLEAARARADGDVELRVDLDEKGTPVQVVVLSGPGHGLDEASARPPAGAASRPGRRTAGPCPPRCSTRTAGGSPGRHRPPGRPTGLRTVRPLS